LLYVVSSLSVIVVRPAVVLQLLIVVPLCPILLHQKASKAASLLAL
jgi:hypothetical protein